MFISLSLYIHIYIYIYVFTIIIIIIIIYFNFPVSDSVKQWIPEQPSPWRKSCKRESCYGDRV